MGRFFERLKTALGKAPGGKQEFLDSDGKVSAVLPENSPAHPYFSPDPLSMAQKSVEGILNAEKYDFGPSIAHLTGFRLNLPESTGILNSECHSWKSFKSGVLNAQRHGWQGSHPEILNGNQYRWKIE